MARASGERAPAFSTEELEKLVDGVLPQYTLLYGPPDKQVSAHQKKDSWRAIAKNVRTLGVYHRRSTHCCKRWEDIHRWSKKTAEAQLGMASQCLPVLVCISIIRRRSSGTGAGVSCIPHGPGGRDNGLGVHQWDGGRGELHGEDRS
ncbi:hypothetical protein NDU88_006978 [Pleurodeles waltl]|uniref:Myb/SANT-like DNA-binding domain-containing protein n=1 Tax=Pleurodeles waltl TaxID=8319 RepID=A0AAV7NRV0_PLEWA|nr:hypothetical protein NDU88_006978 [Pleurodeles waltl]